MSTSNILSLPFRKSTQIALSASIRQYIAAKYDQHPDMFRHDLEVIDSLRRDAINVREAHQSGIKKLQTYAGQLVWISGKFPNDIGTEFTWYPALGYNTERPHVANNLKYELLNILYNLAALYSQLAMSSNRGATEGLKTAASYFSQAAGVLHYMKTTILPDFHMDNAPEDMDEATLEALMQLCLAQSQECFWQKAVMDGYKDGSIAKLAARVSDLYSLASEAAMKSEAISSAWIHHMSAKHHHFAAAAQYRAACDCLEKRRYGEEIARLTDALNCVNEGLKETRGTYINKAVIDDLNGLKKKVEEDLKRAEKDNDVIYLNTVPPKSELKILDRANMALAKVPPQVASPYDYLGDHKELGPALFQKLVPFAVHLAVSVYEERRDRLISNSIIAPLENMTDELHRILASLNLPGSLQALEKPLGLPPTLIQHAEEIRQSDALNRLHRGFADIERLRNSDRATFEEGKALLAAEEEEDNTLRRKYGTARWTRPESRADPAPNGGAKLWNQAAEIEGYFASSTSSDAVVLDKFKAVQDLLDLLSGPDRGLLDYVPSSRRTEIPETMRPAIGKLRSAYNDVLRLESRRRKRAEALREKAKMDDIKSDILAEANRLERAYPNTAISTTHFEDFFEKRLDGTYEVDLELLRKEAAEQDRVLAEVQRANQEFEAQKRRMGDKGGKEREAALQKLDNAYYKYKEIVNNVDVGRKFYNDLGRIVGQFKDNAVAWVNERRRDARSLEDEITMPPLSQLSMNSSRQQPRPEQQYHGQQPTAGYGSPNPFYNPQSQAQPARKQPVHSPVEARIQSWADNLEPQQPKPMPLAPPVWSPTMGIKFAQPAPSSSVAGAPQTGGQQGQGHGAAPGTWDPAKGIRFG